MRASEFTPTQPRKDTFVVVCGPSGLPPQTVEHRVLRIEPRASAQATNSLGGLPHLLSRHQTVVFR